VLDEPHITSPDNRDVNGPDTSWETIFTNDYWGRPMNSASSHKSWRPLSILSFRYLKGGAFTRSDLIAHRFINVLTHATVAELTGILATKLLPWDGMDRIYLKLLVKTVFALHPTHVEVINAANRPHLFAVLCSCLLSDPQVNFIWFLLALFVGYLSAETFLFQVVPAACTLTCIAYIQTFHGPRQVSRRPKHLVWQLIHVLCQVWWRILLLGLSAVAYYAGRYAYDWLSIPDGLIRPAENPFFNFQGDERLRNYLYIVAVHVAKAWDLDFVGFSHEYGRECIKPIADWSDSRLWIPAGIATTYSIVGLYLLLKQRRHAVVSIPLLLFLVHVSWMVTLFPISGIVKVGTFIADRIVVASTVSVSILLGAAATAWLGPSQKGRRQGVRLLPLAVVGCFMWRRIHLRVIDWMDPKSLLESSFKTCPRYAKAHLETSKIFSGLYPEHFNLTRSRWHLKQVETIDPEFCDVHQQFAHVAIQESAFLEFEERLVKALMCPYTMGGSTELWNRYWKIALQPNPMSPTATKEARHRYTRYMETLNDAIAAEETKSKESDRKADDVKSPLVGWKREL